MKVVLLAGGTGTRISEESTYRPKPMIQVGGMPIIWHILKEYSYFGFNDFIICAGYMQEYIKEWFSRYFMNTHDVTFDYTKDGEMTVHLNSIEPWKVTICDTGLDTMTGGRIKRIQPYIGNETFLMTYGDGVCDVNIAKLVEFHKTHGKIATLTILFRLSLIIYTLSAFGFVVNYSCPTTPLASDNMLFLSRNYIKVVIIYINIRL